MRALGNNLRVHSELPTGAIKRQIQGFRLNMPLNPAPPGLYEAAVRCRDNDEWISFCAIGPVGEKDIVCLRRVTDYSYRGGMALLTVLPPDRKE